MFPDKMSGDKKMISTLILQKFYFNSNLFHHIPNKKTDPQKTNDISVGDKDNMKFDLHFI